MTDGSKTCPADYIVSMDVNDKAVSFTSSINDAKSKAEYELQEIAETIESVKNLKPDCDKLDYILSASSGALCGIIDVFLVGKPGESPLGKVTDQWFAERTRAFAKLLGWKGQEDSPLPSAIRFLEKTFKVPYDQRGMGDAASFVFDLNAANHHFKSLGHNPTLLGLFFSILDQFTNTSHFVSNGELLSLQDADGSFYLQGNSVPAKLFCGFANWIGHLISDASGSSSSKGRGMGIPSPFWAWTNDVVALRRVLHIPSNQFDRTLTDFAVKIYTEGFDARFQTAQFIPVFINETVVRLVYFIRRMLGYFSRVETHNRSLPELWKDCEPFSNPSVKRMLTVAHGTFCVVDLGDAAIRGLISGGGSFNFKEFFLRVNIAGVGRFTISLYGELKRSMVVLEAERDADLAKRQRIIIEGYITSLKTLADKYDDKDLTNLVYGFQTSDMYLQVFKGSIQLAEKRGVPDGEILKTKADIDQYFKGGE